MPEPYSNYPDHDLLIRLDEKVTMGFENLEKTMKAVTDGQGGHERRIGSLERWRSYVLGIAATAGALASVIINWLTTR